MDSDQPIQLLASLSRHETLLSHQCSSLERCVDAVSNANSILTHACSRLVTGRDGAKTSDMHSSSLPKSRSKPSSNTRFHEPVNSRLRARSEESDQSISGITAWKSRVSCLRAGVDEHVHCLKEVGKKLGLEGVQSIDMHRQIHQRQQALLRQSCMEFVNSIHHAKAQQQETRCNTPTADRRIDVLTDIETLYVIRSQAAELEGRCFQEIQGSDVRSSVASLEHLVSLHKRTMAGRSDSLVPEAEVLMWRTRALRCMGVHSAEDESSAQGPGTTACRHMRPAVLSTTVHGFDQTSVFRHVQHMHALNSMAGSGVHGCSDVLPGIVWLPEEALRMMVNEDMRMEQEGHGGMPEAIRRPVSVLVSDAALARAWFASLFQMQSLVSELHKLRTTAPQILKASADIVRLLRTKSDSLSKSRVAWLARLLHMLLLPTSRCTLSIGKVCKRKVETDQ